MTVTLSRSVTKPWQRRHNACSDNRSSTHPKNSERNQPAVFPPPATPVTAAYRQRRRQSSSWFIAAEVVIWLSWAQGAYTSIYALCGLPHHPSMRDGCEYFILYLICSTVVPCDASGGARSHQVTNSTPPPFNYKYNVDESPCDGRRET